MSKVKPISGVTLDAFRDRDGELRLPALAVRNKDGLVVHLLTVDPFTGRDMLHGAARRGGLVRDESRASHAFEPSLLSYKGYVLGVEGEAPSYASARRFVLIRLNAIVATFKSKARP